MWKPDLQDFTEIFQEASAHLKVGENLRSNGYDRTEASIAIELFHEKMDPIIKMNMGDTISKRVEEGSLSLELSDDDYLQLIDSHLCGEMAWFNGLSLYQSILGNLYAHKETLTEIAKKRDVLALWETITSAEKTDSIKISETLPKEQFMGLLYHVFTVGTIQMVDQIVPFLKSSAIVMEEDIVLAKGDYNYFEDVPVERTIMALKAFAKSLVSYIKGKGKSVPSILCVPAGKKGKKGKKKNNTQGSMVFVLEGSFKDDIKENIAFCERLLSRVVLRVNWLELMMELNSAPFNGQNVAALLKDTHNILTDIPKGDDIKMEDRLGYCPTFTTQRLLSMPRSADVVEIGQVFEFELKYIEDMLFAYQVTEATTMTSILDLLFAFSDRKPEIVARGVFFKFVYPLHELVHGTKTIEKFVADSFIAESIISSKETPATINMVAEKMGSCFKDTITVATLSHSRQRRKIAVVINTLLDSVYVSMQSPKFPKCVYMWGFDLALTLMNRYIVLGFPLGLYQPHEALWNIFQLDYLGNLHQHYLKNLMLECEIQIMQKASSQGKRKKGGVNLTRMKRQAEEKIAHDPRVHILEVRRVISRAIFRIGLLHYLPDFKIPCGTGLQDNELAFNHRFRCLVGLPSPGPLTFAKFEDTCRQLAEAQEHVLDDCKHLLQDAKHRIAHLNHHLTANDVALKTETTNLSKVIFGNLVSIGRQGPLGEKKTSHHPDLNFGFHPYLPVVTFR
eukprot:TRINITY_DN615689_c1_g2_i1.p1 TRINITY_DN615689_c1_g2~~TRINITY_DN615689_c1_g2_i1.p1  ORF type:complete len:734 (-),score=215.61 TRINITY_DN615689_c1_g2_i1:162-2363(-)